MTRHVTDMLRDAAADLERVLCRIGIRRHDIRQADIEGAFLAHSDVAALIQDVAALEADNDRLRKALRAVTKERDEMREQRNAARCDDNLGPLLAASLEGS